MRRILLNLSLLALVAAPLSAHAGPATATDLLTLTETSGGSTVYSFLVPSAPTSFTTDGVNYFELTNIPVSTDGGPAVLDTVGFLTSTGGTGLYDLSSGLNIFGPLFFNDDLIAPVFTLGSGSTGVTDQFENAYSYTLTSSTASPAPEPSAFVLLGTGALGLFGAFRRRFVA